MKQIFVLKPVITYLFLFVFLIAFLASCKKNEVQDTGDYRIKSIVQTDGSFEAHFSYDASGRLSRYTRSWNGGNIQEYELTYEDTLMIISSNVHTFQVWHLNENGQPFNIVLDVDEGVFISYNQDGLVDTLKRYSSFGGDIENTTTYAYAGQQLTEMRYYNNLGDLLGYRTIEYDPTGKPIKYGQEHIHYNGSQVVGFWNQTSFSISSSSFFYLPENERLYTRVDQSAASIGQHETITNYTYEKGTGVLPWYWQSPKYVLLGMPNFLNYTYWP